MPDNRTSDGDYSTLGKKGSGRTDSGLPDLKPSRNKKKEDSEHVGGLVNPSNPKPQQLNDLGEIPEKLVNDEFRLESPNTIRRKSEEDEPESIEPLVEEELYADKNKRIKREKRVKRDVDLLGGDSWIKRNGHYVTFIGLYLFSILVLYRPYELVPGLGFLSATAFYFAAATIAVYIPLQLSAESTLTYLSFEVKMILALTAVAAFSIFVSKSKMTAWKEFNEVFIKAVAMFIVMVNVLRTRRRLVAMIWLSVGIGVILSVIAIQMYVRGDLSVEGYRVGVDIGGMFGNPNDLALHLVTMIPIVLCLGLASRKAVPRVLYIGLAVLMTAGMMVTYSRGGFLGFVCVSAFLLWKLGKKNRLQVMAFASVAGLAFLIFAPGNYGIRLLSIVIPGLDDVGSSSQRTELLKRSILVSIRNPWGIGIGNFPIVGIRNLVSHNSYTQVSAELGIAGLMAFVLFMVSPFRKLAAIERQMENDRNGRWFYYLAIGLQASLIGFMVSSFFVSVAYTWFIYYIVAYAVAFRRIYSLEYDIEEEKGGGIKSFLPGYSS